MTTTTGQKGHFFIKSRGLLLFLVFLVASALFVLAGMHYHDSAHFSASDGSTLTITGAPGELVSVTVNAGSSLSGNWATPNGLTLTLNSPTNFSTLLIAPRDRTWPSHISTSSSNPDDDMTLTGSFVIPSSIAENGQPISGQISGQVEYPDDLGYAFTEKTKNVNVSVRLNPVSASSVFLTAQLPLYLATGLGALVLLTLPLFFRLYDIRRKQPFQIAY